MRRHQHERRFRKTFVALQSGADCHPKHRIPEAFSLASRSHLEQRERYTQVSSVNHAGVRSNAGPLGLSAMIMIRKVLPMSDAEPALPLLTRQPGEISIPAHVESWDDYFLYIATVVSIKSKDPKCAVGAVIVSRDNIILSTGFNGLARGVHDDDHTLSDADEKLKIICHAENNAILNAARTGGLPLEGATIYVTKFPCLACCNAIIQSGLKRVYTHDDAYWGDDPADQDHSRKRRVLHEAHVQVDAPYHPDYKPSYQIIVPKRKKQPGRVSVAEAAAKVAGK